MESNKEQTALNWLLSEYFGGEENCTPDFVHHIKIALKMEKQQIIDAWYVNLEWSGKRKDKDPAEEYYEETFES